MHYLQIHNLSRDAISSHSQKRGKDSPSSVKSGSGGQKWTPSRQVTSQERVLKMAEDERINLDQMIAQGQKHKQDIQDKRSRANN